MRAAMNAEFPVPGFSVVDKYGGKTGREKPEASFVDTFSKAMKKAGEKAPKPESANLQKSEAQTDKAQSDKEQPGKMQADKPEESVKEQKNAENGKPQKVDDGLALLQAQMMLAEPEIPPEEPVVDTENLTGMAVQAEAEPKTLQEAVINDSQNPTQNAWFQVQTEPLSDAVEQTAAQEAGKTVLNQKPVDSIKQTDGNHVTEMAAFADENPVVVQSGTEAENHSGFSDMLKQQSEAMKAGNHPGRVTEDSKDTETPDEAVTSLEDLKRNAQASGLDFSDRMVSSRINGTFHTMSANSQSTVQETPVLAQLKTGLNQAVKHDMQEFTIHLKPEGLGDIVIKMASAGGKLTVNIGVTNSDTEKLINSQMMSLKEMLEPLHAEVGEVYHDSQAAMNFLEYGQDMQRQQSQQQAFRFGNRRNAMMTLDEEEILAAAEQMKAQSSISKLYAYV